jgi:DNA ligase (NAD+)
MNDLFEQSIEDEILQLRETLRQYQHEYYIEAKPTVSDLTYDRLMDRLIQLETENPQYRLSDSPSQRVGSDLNADFPEVSHTVPILSLDKAYTPTALLQWIEKSENRGDNSLSFVIEEKIDGVSMVLYYEKGLLVRAVTRGNGYVGNDVTTNIKTIGSVPLRLKEAVTIAVRGEVYLAKQDFLALNEKMEIPYANPRNLAAGTVRRLKSSEAAKVPLTMFVYEGFGESAEIFCHDHVEMLAFLARLGFRINPSIGVFACDAYKAALEIEQLGLQGAVTGGFEDIAGYIDEIAKRRQSLDYEIDGLVVKINDLAMREQFGYTGHHPRWALAYKFEAPQAETTVLSIDVQVGRTGRITPVARVQSVSIGGSVVSNITLHNQDYVNLLELAIGDTVAISKRGDVIPAVERVVEKNSEGNTTWRLPAQCPVCGTSLVPKGAHVFCPNPYCKEQIMGRISFFVGRDQMDIEGFGPETVSFLVEKGWLKDIPDIYTIDYSLLIGEVGFGVKKATSLTQSVEKSKTRPFRKVLVSLGIPDFGKKAADLLVSAGIRSIDALLDLVDSSSREPLLSIKGFGEKTVDSLFEYFSNPVVRERIERLKDAGLTFIEEKAVESVGLTQIFAGQTWCVTGSFERFAPRSLALVEIESRGGRTTGSVTGKTTHLLAGTGAGSKLEQARTFKVQIVTEEDFLQMLSRSNKEDGDNHE